MSLLSNFVLNFNVRHCMVGVSIASLLKWALATPVQFYVVRLCRLTLSSPR